MNQKGFSIVEVMLSTAMASVAALAASTMIVNQQTQVGNIEKKMVQMENKNFVQQSLSNSEVCLWQLTEPGIALNVSAATSSTHFSPTKIPLNKIYAGKDDKSPVLAEVKRGIGFKETGPKITSISFENIYELSEDFYRGEVIISFEELNKIPTAPMRVPVSVATDRTTPKTAKKITSCSAGTNMAAPAGSLCGWGSVSSNPNVIVDKLCDSQFPTKVSVNAATKEPVLAGDCPVGYQARVLNWSYSDDGCDGEDPEAACHMDYSGIVTCMKE